MIGSFLTSLVLLTSPASAQNTEVPLIIGFGGMFDAGSISVPCQPESIPTQCKVDTGINISFFRPDVFKTKPKPTAVAKYTSVTGDTITCSFISLPQVKIGDSVTLNNFEPVTCPANTEVIKENLIGLDALANKSFTVDVPNKKLIFHSTEGTFSQTYQEADSGHIIVEVQIGIKNPVTILAMLDTGAAITAVDLNLAKKYPDIYTIVKDFSTISDTFGNKIESYMAVAGLTVFGGKRYVAEYNMVMDLSTLKNETGKNVEMIIGYNLLKSIKLNLNTKNKTWSVE